jgi:demethylmenaquinone methyltransferase/2-methoxy-6-polyprenyl-1,4-benzoquinol methylase
LHFNDKKSFVRRMFDDIPARYDLLNTIVSFGQDRRWRRKTLADMPLNGTVIDLCSGGGELARELLARPDFKGEIVLADISKGMIMLNRRILGPAYCGRYLAVICDVENLPFKNDIFSGAMCAFSLRNLTDLGQFSDEVKRVLIWKGVARFLEIAHPENSILGALFKFYFYRLSPLIARLFTNKKYAYDYLPRSLKAFPRQGDVLKLLSSGWAKYNYENIFGGIAAIYVFEKGKDIK